MPPDDKYRAIRLQLRQSVREGFYLFLQLLALVLIAGGAAGLIWFGLMFTGLV